MGTGEDNDRKESLLILRDFLFFYFLTIYIADKRKMIIFKTVFLFSMVKKRSKRETDRLVVLTSMCSPKIRI